MEEPSDSLGNQLPDGINPMTPSVAGVCMMLRLTYQTFCDAHQPGTAVKAVPSAKSISIPPPLLDLATRAPAPRGTLCTVLMSMRFPSTRSSIPEGLAAPVKLG